MGCRVILREGRFLKVLIRCDASATIGGGHVIRCLALAEALSDRGADITFAVSSDSLNVVDELHRTPYRIESGFQTDASDTHRLQALSRDRFDIAIIDHYGIGKSEERSIREAAKSIIVITDAPDRSHDCDVLLDATLGRLSAEYDRIIPTECLRLCGSSYALLRPPFRNLRREIKPPRVENASVLVSFGLTDNLNATSLTLRVLAGMSDVQHVVAVLGSKAPHLAEVRSIVDQFPWMKIVTDADAQTMASLMSECDLVLGAPGSASYERCCLGRSSVLIQLADNQASNAKAIVDAGAASLAGIWPDIAPDVLHRHISELIVSQKRLQAMHEAALLVTDGSGAKRAADAIIAHSIR